MVLVILTIHTMIILALIGVVLLQRSEGGAVLSGGNFMTGRGTANALTRTTSILAGLFFATSITLAIIAARGEKARSVVEEITGAPAEPGKGPQSADDLLKSLGADPDGAPAPSAATPAPAPAAAPAEPAPSAAPDAAAPAGQGAAAPAETAPSDKPAPQTPQ
jgi:preprotein translocase subunit SecG